MGRCALALCHAIATVLKPEFKPFDHLLPAGKQPAIVPHIMFRHEAGIAVIVGQPEYLVLMAHPVTIKDSAAGEHGASLPILRKEADAREMIKKRLKR